MDRINKIKDMLDIAKEKMKKSRDSFLEALRDVTESRKSKLQIALMGRDDGDLNFQNIGTVGKIEDAISDKGDGSGLVEYLRNRTTPSFAEAWNVVVFLQICLSSARGHTCFPIPLYPFGDWVEDREDKHVEETSIFIQPTVRDYLPASKDPTTIPFPRSGNMWLFKPNDPRCSQLIEFLELMGTHYLSHDPFPEVISENLRVAWVGFRDDRKVSRHSILPWGLTMRYNLTNSLRKDDGHVSITLLRDKDRKVAKLRRSAQVRDVEMLAGLGWDDPQQSVVLRLDEPAPRDIDPSGFLCCTYEGSSFEDQGKRFFGTTILDEDEVKILTVHKRLALGEEEGMMTTSTTCPHQGGACTEWHVTPLDQGSGLRSETMVGLFHPLTGRDEIVDSKISVTNTDDVREMHLSVWGSDVRQYLLENENYVMHVVNAAKKSMKGQMIPFSVVRHKKQSDARILIKVAACWRKFDYGSVDKWRFYHIKGKKEGGNPGSTRL